MKYIKLINNLNKFYASKWSIYILIYLIIQIIYFSNLIILLIKVSF